MSRPAAIPGETLPARARAAIGQALGLSPPPSRHGLDSRLLEPAACFVTLTIAGELRGCVGSLEPHRPLVDDVEANARAAAFEDPRFAPLTAADYPAIAIEVSVLGPLEPLAAEGEEDLCRRLEPGVDGVVLTAEGRRATFLPQVWRHLPAPRDFVDQLRRKAGLEPDFWARAPSFYRYRVDRWAE